MSSRSEMPDPVVPKDEDESGIPGLSLTSAPAPHGLKEREPVPPPIERIVKTPQVPLRDSPALTAGAVAAQ